MSRFDCRVSCLPAIPDLVPELAGLLLQIPTGQVATYGDLADALGTRSAARWVGEFLRKHTHAPDCPCHRVVRKSGELGLYVHGCDGGEKERKLRAEGVGVVCGSVEHFEELVFRDFRSERPLASLVEFQERIADCVRLDRYDGTPNLVAGLDVSYRRDGTAVGACAVVEIGSGHLAGSIVLCRRPDLPYIPGLLTFRELPLLLDLFEAALRQWPELNLYLIDGNGILHPRKAGVATCFGVVANVHAIGVAKSLLCGQLESGSPTLGGSCLVRIKESIVGAVLRRRNSVRALYVSPANKMDVASAIRIAALLDRGHRLPEPLYWADRLSRTEAHRTGS